MDRFKINFLLLLVFFASEVFSATQVQPKAYKLNIVTSPEDFQDSDKDLRFKGTVEIEFKVLNNDNKNELHFTLNADLATTVEKFDVKGVRENGSDEPLTGATLNNEKGLLNVTVPKLKTQYSHYIVLIDFTNSYKNDMTGFYRSYYLTKEGKKRWMVTTHFEPTYARSAFPCFDDPSLKATFLVKVSYPASLNGYEALSNTPIDSKNLVDNMMEIKFKQTPLPMSTYLVAFAVSDFASTDAKEFESNYPDNYPKSRNLVTHGRKELIDHGDGQLSLDVGVEAIKVLSAYLEKGYGFQKVDFVGVPDFSVGAMENWGLITYREKILFYNAVKGSAQLKQSNALTIVHELVHQWFGNLVTLRSWNYIWLNEAFATYLSYITAAELKNPNTSDWGYLRQLLYSEVHSKAFEIDGLSATKPLSQNHDDENLVVAAFDDVPYAKGCSVLRMWDLTLPKDMFKKSLAYYIKQNSEKNVVPQNLLDAFKNITEMEESFFKTWVEQPGYPVVTVKKEGDSYTLSQNRFFWEKPDKSLEGTKYTVPISYTEASGSTLYDTRVQVWLQDKDISMKFTGDWFLINNQQAGYYRVNYEKENWLALAKALNASDFSKIHELNRAQIVNDIYSLARSVHKKYVSYDVALTLTSYLAKETSYVVWKTALNAFEFLRSKVSQNENTFKNFRNYILNLIEPHFKPLNATSDKHLDRLMNAQMASWACALNYEPCIASAKDNYLNAFEYPDTVEVILCTAAAKDNKLWKEIFEKYKSELDSSKKTMLISVLGCTDNIETIKYYMNLTLNNDFTIRKQDRVLALTSVFTGNVQNVEIVFDFVEENYEAIANEFGGINPLGKILKSISKRLHSSNNIEKMEALVKKIRENKKVTIPPESLDNAISVVRSNQAWVQEKMHEVEVFLNSGSAQVSYSILLLLISLISCYML